MKKPIVVVVVILALLAAAFAFYRYRHGAGRVEQVAKWLPAGTCFFEELPDIHRSEKRWPKTALAQILNEPQVQAFLEKPRTAMPGHDETDRRIRQLQAVDPVRFFLAVTDLGGEKLSPKAVLGLSYGGDRQQLESLVSELRKAVQTAWPAGKSDVVKYGDGEIETFTLNQISVGLAYRGHWVFLGLDIDLLKSVLDGCDGKAAPDSLATNDAFKKCLGEAPGDADGVVFLQAKTLADRFASLMTALQPSGPQPSLAALKKISAFEWTVKMDGPLMRDQSFVLMDQPPAGAGTLARHALKLSTADTVLLGSSLLQNLQSVTMPGTGADSNAALGQLLGPYLKMLANQGLTADQFDQAFGPEQGFLLDWPADATVPSLVAALDVKDSAKARKFLDALTTLPPGARATVSAPDKSNVVYYTFPPIPLGVFPLQFSVALADPFVLAGLAPGAVQAAAKRLHGTAGLEGSDTYKDAAALVPTPTQSYWYVDTKAIFERVFNLVRGVATMGFIPHSGDFVDLSKIPETQTIAKHLGPLVFSQSSRDGGVFSESAGPVSMSQAGFVAGLTAFGAAISYIRGFGGIPTLGPLHAPAPRRAPAAILPAPPLPSAPTVPAPIPSGAASASGT